MKVSVNAAELTNLSVAKVSLVKRGANREPFTLIKSEDEVDKGTLIYKAAEPSEPPEPVVDTTKNDSPGMIGRAVKKMSDLFTPSPEAAPIAVSAVLVKEEKAEEYAPLLEKQGFAVDDTDINDGVVVYKQEGYDAEAEGTVVGLNDDVAVATTDVVKYFTTYTDTSDFGTAVEARMFWPGVYAATGAFEDVLFSILDNADSASGASSDVDSAVSSFGDYVKNLISGLPTDLFKLDGVLKQNLLTEPSERSTVPNNDFLKSDLEDTAMTAEVFEGTLARKVDGELVEAPYTYEKAEDGSEIFLAWGEIEKVEPVADPTPASKSDEDAPSWFTAFVEKTDERLSAIEKANAETGELVKGTVITQPTGTSEDVFDVMIEKAGTDEERELWKTEQMWLKGNPLFNIQTG